MMCIIYCAEMVFMKPDSNRNEGIQWRIQFSFERKFNWIHFQESKVMCFFFFFKSLLTFGFKANFFIFPGGIDGPAICSILFLPKSRLSPCSYMRHVPLITSLCVRALCCVWLFVTSWTGAHWAPLTMGFPRQEYWRGLPFLAPRDLSDPWRSNLCFSCASCIGRQILYPCPTGEDPITLLSLLLCIIICQMHPAVFEML